MIERDLVGGHTGPTSGVPSEKVGEPMLYGFFCLGSKD